eukprot:7980629-Lingulodinium_polyedra.AAC.1
MAAYLLTLEADGCAPSVPGAVMAALAVMERAGSIPEDQRLSRRAALRNLSDGIAVQLGQGQGDPRKAPRYSLAM